VCVTLKNTPKNTFILLICSINHYFQSLRSDLSWLGFVDLKIDLRSKICKMYRPIYRNSINGKVDKNGIPIHSEPPTTGELEPIIQNQSSDKPKSILTKRSQKHVEERHHLHRILHQSETATKTQQQQKKNIN
jgi:hypothetical protein